MENQNEIIQNLINHVNTLTKRIDLLEKKEFSTLKVKKQNPKNITLLPSKPTKARKTKI